jgi:Recombinase zinc beta ribbon domain
VATERQEIMAARPQDQWVWLPNANVEPLITTELFDAANAALTERFNEVNPTKQYVRPSLLAQLIRCGECGHRMAACFRVTPGWSPYYRCTGNDTSRGARRNGCGIKCWAGWVEDAVWSAVKDELFRDGFLEAKFAALKSPEADDAVQRDLKSWTKRRQAAERKLKTLLDCDVTEMTSAVRDAVNGKIKDIDREIREADRQLVDLKSRLIPVEQWESAKAMAERRVAAYRAIAEPGELTLQQKRDVLVGLGTRVSVKRDRSLDVTVDLDIDFGSRAESHNSSEVLLVGDQVVDAAVARAADPQAAAPHLPEREPAAEPLLAVAVARDEVVEGQRLARPPAELARAGLPVLAAWDLIDRVVLLVAGHGVLDPRVDVVGAIGSSAIRTGPAADRRAAIPRASSRSIDRLPGRGKGTRRSASAGRPQSAPAAGTPWRFRGRGGMIRA